MDTKLDKVFMKYSLLVADKRLIVPDGQGEVIEWPISDMLLVNIPYRLLLQIAPYMFVTVEFPALILHAAT